MVFFVPPGEHIAVDQNGGRPYDPRFFSGDKKNYPVFLCVLRLIWHGGGLKHRECPSKRVFFILFLELSCAYQSA